MLKLTIVTNEVCLVLGINGVESFFKALNTKEIQSVMILSPEIMEKLEAMQTYDVGFTEGYKKDFIMYLKKEVGNYICIVDRWLDETDVYNIAYAKELTKQMKLNEGDYGKAYNETHRIMNEATESDETEEETETDEYKDDEAEKGGLYLENVTPLQD